MPCKHMFKTGLLLTTLLATPALPQARETGRPNISPLNQAVLQLHQGQHYDAFNSFLELARSGNHIAQYNVAVLLNEGVGVPQDFLQALKWAWIAQLGGVGKAEDLAQNLVSSIPEQSRGDIEDMVLAYLDDRLAMDHIQSVTQKARFFEEIIAEPDNVRALTWWILASAINMQTAVSRRNDLIDEMTPEDVLEAQIEAQKIFTEENFTDRFIIKNNST